MLRIKYPEEIEQKMRAFFETLNEKDRRRYAAIEAIKLGHGGQKYICSVLGCHFQIVMAGINEITNGTDVPEERIRKAGGGRKKIIETEENIDDVFRNNIIVNTQKRKKDPDGTGYGIINNLPETHTFMLENNCLYNNVGGNYKNANSMTDTYVNPLFVDQKNHDYRLISNVQIEQRTAIRAFLRFETQKIRTGIAWFETKWSITKNAVNQFLKDPISILYKM